MDLASPALMSPDRRARAIATITSVFANDPVERWLWPEDDEYAAHVPTFVEAFAGPAFERQTTWMLDDCSAVALWLAPGTEPDGESRVAVVSETVAAAKHEDTSAVLEQMERTIRPHRIGISHGWRSSTSSTEKALDLRSSRNACPTLMRAAYPRTWRTPNPRTIPLYERHGFEATAVAQAAGCPPITQMLREAG